MASRRTGKPSPTIDVRVRSAVARGPVSCAEVERLTRAVLAAERVRAGWLSITLVGRRRIRALNRRYLRRDAVTDVIAFPLRGAPGVVAGDVYCCPEAAASAARRFGTTAADEVRRTVIHGVLHVLGYDHAAGAGRTTGTMWRRQETYLARFGGAGGAKVWRR